MSTEERPKADLIERVRKILTKTEATNCTQAEAASALAFASKLMAEHNLTVDEVNASTDAAESWLEDEVYETGRWGLEDSLVYGIVKEFFFVEGFFNLNNGKKVLLFFGKASNVAAARNTWNSLHAAFDRLWTMYRILNRRPAGERRLFVSGLAKGFAEKLRDERRAMEIERDIVQGTASGGTALALRSVADETLAEYRKAHPKHGKATRGRFAAVEGDRSTLQAGYEAGKVLNFAKGVEGQGQKGIGNG
jgi:plasmid stabilization system protein ParE